MRSIQHRLIRAALVGVVVVAALSLVALMFARNALRDNAKRELVTLGELQQARITEQLAFLEFKAGSVAADGLVARYVTEGANSTPALAQHLAARVQALPDMMSFSVYDRDGRFVADSSSAGLQHVPSAFPAGYMAGAQESIAGGRLPKASPAFGTTADARYYDAYPVMATDGGVVAVLYAELCLAPVDAVVASAFDGVATVDTHLIQRRGDVVEFITDPKAGAGMRFNSAVPVTATDLPAVRAALGYEGIVEGTRDYRGEKVIAYAKPLDQAPWSLVVKMDEAEAYMLMRDIGVYLAGALLAALLLVVAGYGFLSQSMVGRIRRLTASAQAISQGSLSTRIGDPSDDELGQLGRTFDTMADTLADDIARRERVEAELAHRALHDELTSLPNRGHFAELLGSAVARRSSVGGELAVLFIDLDQFKAVNDELGHTAGDALLRAVAHRFSTVLTEHEVMARFGGDEFVVLCSELDDLDSAEVVASRLIGSLEAPITVAELDVFVTASIGIAVVNDDATPESLIRDADVAMYHAKSLGRGRHALHNVGMRATPRTQLSARADVRRALDDHAFEMVYQPIVDLGTLRCLGYEALARWPRADGVALPQEFVPMVAELDLTATFDEWAVMTACQALPTLQATPGVRSLFVSVNVATPTLLLPGFADKLLAEAHVLYQSGRSLCLEITEQEIASVSEPAIAVLTRLRAAGLRISIDDFGTGSSSLARLRQLPVDVLKIDRQFVEDIDTDGAARAMCSAVIGMGRDLGLRVIAEGVERRAQVQVLRELGCEGGQGFLFGRPGMAPPHRNGRRLTPDS